ncbi:hypothetical protein [Desulforamulus hydrothermalis]|nr:hypothetical protein [Desulforamulus hydrothermalis]
MTDPGFGCVLSTGSTVIRSRRQGGAAGAGGAVRPDSYGSLLSPAASM